MVSNGACHGRNENLQATMASLPASQTARHKPTQANTNRTPLLADLRKQCSGALRGNVLESLFGSVFVDPLGKINVQEPLFGNVRGQSSGMFRARLSGGHFCWCQMAPATVATKAMHLHLISYQMRDAECELPNASCQMRAAKCEKPNASCQMREAKCVLPSVRCRM